MSEIKNNFYEELQFRGIKMLDISYVVTLYATIALISASFTEKFFHSTDEEIEELSITELFIQTYMQIILMAIIFYFVRNIVEQIPSPFNKIGNFDHYRLAELKNGSTFMIFYIANTPTLRLKTLKLIEKFNKSYQFQI